MSLPGSIPAWVAFVTFGVLMLAGVEAQDITAGSSCAAVLQQGTYNTFQTSTTGSSYSEAHSSACKDYSDYTYR